MVDICVNWIGLYFLKVFHVVDSKIGWRQELQRGLKSSSKSLWCSEPISLYCREVVVMMMMMAMIMAMMIMMTINDDDEGKLLRL